MKSSAGKIQLAGFDDLFQASGETETNGERVQEIPLIDLCGQNGGAGQDAPFIWSETLPSKLFSSRVFTNGVQ